MELSKPEREIYFVYLFATCTTCSANCQIIEHYYDYCEQNVKLDLRSLVLVISETMQCQVFM